mmetsp:Transcript_30888/g.47673  ORF Transcript_30888/g.47673 Transcript_30888/m.47673 type:complete len:221 (-) Transcript_30888:24-686(-)
MLNHKLFLFKMKMEQQLLPVLPEMETLLLMLKLSSLVIPLMLQVVLQKKNLNLVVISEMGVVWILQHGNITKPFLVHLLPLLVLPMMVLSYLLQERVLLLKLDLVLTVRTKGMDLVSGLIMNSSNNLLSKIFHKVVMVTSILIVLLFLQVVQMDRSIEIRLMDVHLLLKKFMFVANTKVMELLTISVLKTLVLKLLVGNYCPLSLLIVVVSALAHVHNNQ